MTFDHIDDDHELDDFVAGIKADAERSDLRPRPDFAEVVRRAQAMAPEAIDDAAIDEAASLAEVVPLGVSAEPEPPADPELDAFIYDVRLRNQAIADERRMAGIPELALLRERPSSRRPLFAGLLALAAALALLFFVARPVLLGGGAGGDGAVEAQRVYDGAATGRAIGPTGPRLETSAPSPAASAGEGGHDDRADTTTTPADAHGVVSDGVDPERTTDADAPRPAKTRREIAPESELEALDRQAQAAWRRGDLGEAERLLAALTERGGTSGHAELAFGDLFTLAHQRGRPAAQARYWRSYLRVFPRGRFADDARAGLCRQREGTAAATCWRRYLVRHPQGSHRVEAEEALARQAKREETR
ncbi:MAG: hypothetical protein KC486_30480 [Myxococcales bacterium]|nr:hypothetical protein [Myxococcales bacterium]